MFAALVNWCQRLVSRGLKWIEQQLQHHTTPSTMTTVVGTAGDLLRTREDLLLENALLRQQLVVLKRSVKQVQPTNTDRRIIVWLSSRLKVWREALLVVKPATVLAWHRTLFRLFWRRKSQAKEGRPALPQETVTLIKQMAIDNRLWGAERIQGDLLKLGIHVCKRTIQKYMRQARPKRPSGQTWATFLHNHAPQIWACDFLPIIDLFFRQFYAYFIVELGSRRVVHVGVTDAPTDVWVAQQLREATPFGDGPKYLIRDNDSKFGIHFAKVAAGAQIEVLKTPVGAPNANAVVERFLGSVRRECLDHLLVVGASQLRQVLKQYVAYFNHQRPHQGIGQQIPVPSSEVLPALMTTSTPPRITCIPILEGLNHAYQRVA